MADLIMTINDDKTASINRSYLGVQGEKMIVTCNVTATLAALGCYAYIDFLKPDGVACYRGGYDCSTETFDFTLGAYDTVLDKAGTILWQFVLGGISDDVRTVDWASLTYKTQVMDSVGAVSAATVPYALHLTDLQATLVWNVGSLVDGAGETSSAITVTGAVLGDYVLVSCSLDTQAMLVYGWVSAADTVKIRVQNETGGTINLASASFYVKVVARVA
jgi:hypothetical protein